LDIHGLNRQTWILTRRNIHWHGKQNRTKRHQNLRLSSKRRLIQRIDHTVNIIEELDDEQIRNAVLLSYIEEVKSEVWINVKTGIVMELAIKENEKKADLVVEELVPVDLHEFLNVFDDNMAN
jgi:hypothetical protein